MLHRSRNIFRAQDISNDGKSFGDSDILCSIGGYFLRGLAPYNGPKSRGLRPPGPA